MWYIKKRCRQGTEKGQEGDKREERRDENVRKVI